MIFCTCCVDPFDKYDHKRRYKPVAACLGTELIDRDVTRYSTLNSRASDLFDESNVTDALLSADGDTTNSFPIPNELGLKKGNVGPASTSTSSMSSSLRSSLSKGSR